MKKLKISIMALAFVATAGLVACGGTQTPTTGSDSSGVKEVETTDTSGTTPVDTSGTGRDSIPPR